MPVCYLYRIFYCLLSAYGFAPHCTKLRHLIADVSFYTTCRLRALADHLDTAPFDLNFMQLFASMCHSCVLPCTSDSSSCWQTLALTIAVPPTG